MTEVQISVRALDGGGNDEFAQVRLLVEAEDLKQACVQGMMRSHVPLCEELGVSPTEAVKAVSGRIDDLMGQLEERGIIGKGLAKVMKRTTQAVEKDMDDHNGEAPGSEAYRP